MSDRMNLIQTIAKQDQFSTFSRLMQASGANEILSGEGSFTVFAPTNDAFATIPEATMNGLTSEGGQAKLKELLSYHILPIKVMAASLVSSSSRKASSGEELMFTDINGLKVNGVSIQARNLEATNGVVHALEKVLTPTRVPRIAVTATSPSPRVPAASSAPKLTIVPNAQAPTVNSESGSKTPTTLSAAPTREND